MIIKSLENAKKERYIYILLLLLLLGYIWDVGRVRGKGLSGIKKGIYRNERGGNSV